MKIDGVADRCQEILGALAQVIVGKTDVLEQILAGVLANGHILIEDFPGLAKTLIARLVAGTLDLSFKRIQFTPDLLPSDITGSFLFDQRQARFEFRPGPIFTHLLLADEINRATPKTQSALLEAMQEGQVTVEGERFPLEAPFLVIATQNPIELEGTYPLPEAQLDRFMFNIQIGYLSEDDEVDVVNQTTSVQNISFDRNVTGPDILAFQHLVRRVPVAESVTRYAVKLVAASRPVTKGAPDFIQRWVNWGASLRASQFLILGGKARAVMSGRYNVSIEDVRALAYPILRHRILLNFHAESERVKPDDVVRRLIEIVPEPKSGL
jgi:MoxR-like ATPase